VEEPPPSTKKHTKRRLRVTEDDYYELLHLGHKRWQATQEEIKRSYRSLILEYHPDKTKGTTEEVFKKIQKAYDVLSDEKERRTYDSMDPFDDQLPHEEELEVETEEEFYALFGSYFSRFSKWSEVTPVPELGGSDTPMDKVDGFYDFWYGFKSWRDYTVEDMYDLEEADSREEKRWMERQNKKMVEKFKREEKARISKLVSMSYQRDPRIKKRAMELEAERRRQKEAKREAIRRKKEEEQRKQLEEQRRKEEEERVRREKELAEKRQREKQNKAARRIRARFRTLCRNQSIEGEVQELLCLEVPATHLQALVKQFSEDEPAAIQEVHRLAGTIRERKAAEAAEQAKKQAQQQAKGQGAATSSRAWTPTELSALAKAVGKFPGGTTHRWKRIQQELLQSVSLKLGVKDIIAKTREIQQEHRPDELKLSKAEAAQAAFSQVKAKGHKVQIESDVTKRYDTSTPGVWSADEQAQLEAAMKKYPSSLGAKRWGLIAECVPGRSKRECYTRFKELVEFYKSKN